MASGTPGFPRSHRLHYRWSQLEADRSGLGVGSPLYPLPRADRELRPLPGREYSEWPSAPSESRHERQRFAACARTYRTSDYNTFCKSGILKLTEVELYFLSSRMTKESSGEWAVVYLGISTGERFRYLRDEFFPDLAVFGFDPLDDAFVKFIASREEMRQKAERWSADGTNFFFELRCFDFERDAAWIQDVAGDRNLLLISDIRGVALLSNGSFDKASDNDLQWKTIQHLRPVSSLVKFAAPSAKEQFYDYVPGVLLKQVFCSYGTQELRIMIEGVPEHTQRYNTWEIWEQMMYHHEHLRGQVYDTSRRHDCTKVLDCCFDCAVLWETASSYAVRNGVDPCGVIGSILRNHVLKSRYDQTPLEEQDREARWRRWRDVEWALQRGRIMTAIFALEASGDEDEAGTDWAKIARDVAAQQPELAQRLAWLEPRPVSREVLIEFLGRLAGGEWPTLIRTEQNGLLYEEDWKWRG